VEEVNPRHRPISKRFTSFAPLASPAAGQSRDGGANGWHWSAAVAGPYQDERAA